MNWGYGFSECVMCIVGIKVVDFVLYKLFLLLVVFVVLWWGIGILVDVG